MVKIRVTIAAAKRVTMAEIMTTPIVTKLRLATLIVIVIVTTAKMKATMTVLMAPTMMLTMAQTLCF